MMLWLSVFLLAALASAVLVVWFERRYRGEIRRRDRRIAVLTAALRNSELYVVELQGRLRRRPSPPAPLPAGEGGKIPGPCFSEYEMRHGQMSWRYWVHWN